jgi:hypothetical protein
VGDSEPADTSARIDTAVEVDTAPDCVPTGDEDPCNGVDDDCDGEVDEGEYITGYVDKDGDGHAGTGLHCSPWATSTEKTDCNDGDGAVHPGAVEVCNGLDDDCDGLADPEGTEGCVQGFEDVDGDGPGGAGPEGCFCFGSTESGDCDDADARRDRTCEEVVAADLAVMYIEGSAAIGPVGDCTGDGLPDLSTGTQLFTDPGPGVWNLGALGPRATTAVEDWNGDGVCDVLAEHQDGERTEDSHGYTYYEDTVTYTLTDGATGLVLGEASLDLDYWDSGGIYTLTTLDIDGDGHRELLAMADDNTSAWWYALRLDGTDGEEPAVLREGRGSIEPSGWWADDVDDDGFDDLVECGTIRLGPVEADFRSGSGSSSYLGAYVVKGFGDLDGDGANDLVMSAGYGADVHWAAVPVLPAGSYEADAVTFATVPSEGAWRANAGVGDLDGDSKDEVVVFHDFGDGYTLRVYAHPVVGDFRPFDATRTLHFPPSPALTLLGVDDAGVRIGSVDSSSGTEATLWLRW